MASWFSRKPPAQQRGPPWAVPEAQLFDDDEDPADAAPMEVEVAPAPLEAEPTVAAPIPAPVAPVAATAAPLPAPWLPGPLPPGLWLPGPLAMALRPLALLLAPWPMPPNHRSTPNNLQATSHHQARWRNLRQQLDVDIYTRRSLGG